MRLLSTALVLVIAAFAITACSSKSDSSSSSEASAAASAPAESSAPAEASPAASSATGDVPAYPGAVTQASGSGSNMGATATGTVMSTDDPFDKVYAWYQQHLPSGSEKSHVTAPVESAVFTLGATGGEQTSVTLTASGGKTMITIGKVKM